MANGFNDTKHFALCTNWTTDVEDSMSLVQTIIKNSEEDRRFSPVMYYVGSFGILENYQTSQHFIYNLHKILEDNGFVLRVALSDGEELKKVENIGIPVEEGWIVLPNLPMILFASHNSSWIDEFTGIKFEYLLYGYEQNNVNIEQVFTLENDTQNSIVILCCSEKNQTEHFSDVFMENKKKNNTIIYHDGHDNYMVNETYEGIVKNKITFLENFKNSTLVFQHPIANMS